MGLGQAVGAEKLAAEHAGKPFLPLLRRPGVEQAEAGQDVHARPDTDARPRGGDLLEDLEVDLVGLGPAAVFLRIGEAEQARPAQRQEDITRERAGPLRVIDPGTHLLVGDFARELDEIGRLWGRHESLRGHGTS